MYIHPWCIFFQAWTCRILCISSCFAESQNKICHQSHLLRPFITYSQNAPDRGYFVSHSCSRNNHRWAPHHFCTAEGSWCGELNGQPDQSRGSRPGDTEHQSTDSAGCRMGLSFFFSVLGLCWFLCLRRGGLLFVAVHSSRHAGFSSCGLQTLEHRVSSCGAQAVALRHVGSAPTRDQTHVPYIERRILSHCATKEVLSGSLPSWLSTFWPQKAYTPEFPWVHTPFLERNYIGMWREAPHAPYCPGPQSLHTLPPRGVTGSKRSISVPLQTPKCCHAHR